MLLCVCVCVCVCGNVCNTGGLLLPQKSGLKLASELEKSSIFGKWLESNF